MNRIQKWITLSGEDEEKLLKILSCGKPREILHANILLMCGKGYPPKVIVKALSTTKQTVNNVKQRYIKIGIDKFAVRANAGKAPYPAKITGDVEARIVALACSQPPNGYVRWTLRLLADKSVELQYIDEISYVSVGSVLKKHNLNLI
jgi:hypothetical protein